jgi:hypothetical protein
MELIHERAMGELSHPVSSDDALAFVAISEQTDVPLERLVPSLELVVGRAEPLSEEEWRGFSYRRVAEISAARERYGREVRNDRGLGAIIENVRGLKPAVASTSSKVRATLNSKLYH